MGVHTEDLDLLAHHVPVETWGNLRFLVLGNQFHRERKERLRAWTKSMGIKSHIGIDLNGLDGCLVRDMRAPVESWGPELVGWADVVLDYGTIEHVGDQFAAWRNVHEMMARDCVFQHIVPRTDGWALDHGDAKYSIAFFKLLAEMNGYEILHLDSKRTRSHKGHPNPVNVRCIGRHTGAMFAGIPYAEIKWNPPRP